MTKKISRNGQINIKIATTVEGIETLRPYWEKMNFHPLSDIDYYLHVLNSSDMTMRPYVMLLSDMDRHQAMVVGHVTYKRLKFKLGYKNLFSLKARCLTIVPGGYMGNMSKEILHAVIRNLLEQLRFEKIDLVFFYGLPADSEICALLKTERPFFVRDNFPWIYMHRRISLPNSFSEYYSSLSKNTRSNIRKYGNRISKKYGNQLSIICLRRPDDIDKITKDTELIAAKTYQRGLGVGFSGHKDRERLLFMLNKGWFRAYILYINRMPVAFWHGLYYKNIFLTQSTGYDPAYKYYHPGNYLLMKIVEQSCTNNTKYIDFARGDAEYKRRYGNQAWKECSFYIFAPTLKGLKISIIRSITGFIDKVVKKVLVQLHLYDSIKKAWRNSITLDNSKSFNNL